MEITSPQDRIQDILLTVGASTAICTAVHLVVAPIWRKAIGQQKYFALRKRERLYLAEKTVSTLNGLVGGGLALATIASGVYHGDVINPYPRLAHYALGFISGYSIYDTTVMALGAHEPLVMWLHHLLGLGGAMGMMYFRKLSFFPVVFALTELTVLPFNFIWYLNKLDVPRNSPLMRFALISRAVAFLALRAPVGLFAFGYAHFQTKGGLAGLWRRIFVNKEVQEPVAVATALNTLAFTIFNMYWTMQAIKASSKGKKPKTS